MLVAAVIAALLLPPLVYEFVLERRLDGEHQQALVMVYVGWVCLIVGLLWGLAL